MHRSLILGLLISISCFYGVTMGEESIPLWPDAHPANTDSGPATSHAAPARPVIHSHPNMLVYLPDDNPTGAAVMVCPGGGYAQLAIDHEGLEVAEWLNARGIAAFVLKYRCGGGNNAHPAPLDDALRGMRLIRSRAREWNINPEKLGVIGFSAGGHLASTVSTLFDEGDPTSNHPIDRHSSRPAFSILVYPVISMDQGITHSGSRQHLLGSLPDDALVEKLSTEKQVSDRTPPTFIAHASDDTSVVPENSLRYYQSLLEHQVPAELHLYERGGHGFGMRTLETEVNGWLDDLQAWLVAHELAEPVGQSR